MLKFEREYLRWTFPSKYSDYFRPRNGVLTFEVSGASYGVSGLQRSFNRLPHRFFATYFSSTSERQLFWPPSSSSGLCFSSRFKVIIFCYDTGMWSLTRITLFSFPYGPHSSLRRSAPRWHAIRRSRHTLVTLYATSVAPQRTLVSWTVLPSLETLVRGVNARAFLPQNVLIIFGWKKALTFDVSGAFHGVSGL